MVLTAFTPKLKEKLKTFILHGSVCCMWSFWTWNGTPGPGAELLDLEPSFWTWSGGFSDESLMVVNRRLVSAGWSSG